MSRVLLIISSMAFSTFVLAEQGLFEKQKPRYEGGIAIANFYLPDYPGSNEMQNVFLPLPYLIYRGDILRADRDGGVRGRFFRRENFEFDFSLGAAFPADSDSNQARSGMQDLDWMGEVGPRLRWHLFRTPIVKLDFNFPIRHVFSSNFYSRWNTRGFVFNPEIELTHRAFFDPMTVFVGSLAITEATEDLMDYLFQVNPSEATAERPVYDAKPGYFGSTLSAFMVKAFPKMKLNLFLGASLNNYKGAKNEDSPLIKDKYTTSYFVGISYGLFESKDTVKAGDE